MTDSHSIPATAERHDGPEIQITSEMIQAGTNELSDFVALDLWRGDINEEAVACAIFRAMHGAQR
jgi:hypothetical protein